MREGEYAKNRIPVMGHALDIPARLKEMDAGYFVMLNTRTQKYEIYHDDGTGGVLQCVLPFGELDERTVRHVRAYRMERMEEIQREVEDHNRRLEEAAQKNWLEEAGERTREAVNYLKHKSDTDEIPKELMER